MIINDLRAQQPKANKATIGGAFYTSATQAIIS